MHLLFRSSLALSLRDVSQELLRGGRGPLSGGVPGEVTAGGRGKGSAGQQTPLDL